MWRMIWGVLGVVIGVSAVWVSDSYALRADLHRLSAQTAASWTPKAILGSRDRGGALRAANLGEGEVTANKAPNATRWDYEIFEVQYVSSPSIFSDTGTAKWLDGQRLSDDDAKKVSLDSLGAAGWELVTATRNEVIPAANSIRITWTYYLKRPL